MKSSAIFNLLRKKFPLQTYTYFIPAPPRRKSGYQEKEFDELIQYITKSGFDIEDIKMNTLSCSESPGVWIICLIRPQNQEAYLSKLNFDYTEVPLSDGMTIEHN